MAVRLPRPPPVTALWVVGVAAVLMATGVVLLAMISEGLEQPYLRAALIVFVLRCMTVDVTDDGVGGADTEKGTGLRGLADRVEAVDGRLRVWTPVGGGTRVRAEIPCG